MVARQESELLELVEEVTLILCSKSGRKTLANNASRGDANSVSLKTYIGSNVRARYICDLELCKKMRCEACFLKEETRRRLHQHLQCSNTA